MSNVLIIGDTHMPCMIDGYIDFLKEQQDWWKCDRVVHCGDLVDNCALSFHLKKPQLKDPLREYDEALEQVEQLTTAFPKADLLLGNHDVLPYRWCDEVGIPEVMMRDFGSIFNLPKKWKVHPRYSQLVIQGVIYQHGDRGRSSAILNAKDELCSVVQGHHHAKAGVDYHACEAGQIFGLQTGCGTDFKHAQQEYGQKYSKKPVLGCGVVIDGRFGHFCAMPLKRKRRR